MPADLPKAVLCLLGDCVVHNYVARQCRCIWKVYLFPFHSISFLLIYKGWKNKTTHSLKLNFIILKTLLTVNSMLTILCLAILHQGITFPLISDLKGNQVKPHTLSVDRIYRLVVWKLKGRRVFGVSHIFVNPDLRLKQVLWSSYFIESRFKTKTMFCGYHLQI